MIASGGVEKCDVKRKKEYYNIYTSVYIEWEKQDLSHKPQYTRHIFRTFFFVVFFILEGFLGGGWPFLFSEFRTVLKGYLLLDLLLGHKSDETRVLETKRRES